ncbi:MAG: hypothetical protein ACW97Z_14395 [Candidatus Hodarchaeales archaeon]|jgi:hypothetical protein
MSQMDQMLQYFNMLTSNELERSFDPEEAKGILSSFSQRLSELYEKLKLEQNFNETQLFSQESMARKMQQLLPD